MYKIRKSQDRGQVNLGWLKSSHTFSFADYYDPAHMRFRVLRVINDDYIAPDSGFGTHPHQNMEIITYVMSGTLQHVDSLGNKGTIQAGEIQLMSAGSGIQHAEMNPSKSEVCHLLQIWIFPSVKDKAPSWEQVEWKSRPASPDGQRLLASPDGRDGSAHIHQDACLWHGDLSDGMTTTLTIPEGRGGWLQLVKGQLTVAEKVTLEVGDGLAVDGKETLVLRANAASEYLWFDLP